MKNIKINHLLEYLSLALILSYFFIHNIFLVFTGITFSLYLINDNFINKFIMSVNKELVNKKLSIKSYENYKKKISNSNQIKYTEESKLTLVETIEELGFIPSIDKKEDSNAA